MAVPPAAPPARHGPRTLFAAAVFLLLLAGPQPQGVLAGRLDRCLACSACEAFASEVISRLKRLDADKDSSFQVSHRLKGYQETVQRRSYRDSELRIVEALDDICLAFRDYKIAQDSDGPRRFFSKTKAKTDITYSRDDKEFIKDSHKHLEWWCSEITVNHEDEISQCIKEEDPDTEEDAREEKFQTALCNQTLGICLRNSDYLKDEKKRDGRFWKWKAKKLEKEAAEKKKKEEEAAKKAAEEAAQAQDEGAPTTDPASSDSPPTDHPASEPTPPEPTTKPDGDL